MKWFLTNLILMITQTAALAQELGTKIEMADQFRAQGKIYVVVAVMLVIIMGLSFLVFRLDRKLARLEDRLAKKNGGNQT